MEWIEFTAKTVNEALTEAMIKLESTIDNLEYEVVEKETNGIFGFFGKPAIIKVKTKSLPDNIAKEFLTNVLKEMNVKTEIKIKFDTVSNILDIYLEGNDMGVVIGKRGQTLDALQYLLSLVVNKRTDEYIKIKLDTENYRERRKETLENLARNIAIKVKKTRKPVSLEPMNPYERRIIHSALQNDKSIQTYSEGEEPYRKVIIDNKKGSKDFKYNNKYNKNYSRDYKKDYKDYKESKEKKENIDI